MSLAHSRVGLLLMYMLAIVARARGHRRGVNERIANKGCTAAAAAFTLVRTVFKALKGVKHR